MGSVPAEPQPTPEMVDLPATARSISVGGQHACAIAEGGLVFCWGGPFWSPGGLRRAERVSLPAHAVEIASGELHACALLQSGDVWCWGCNWEGQVSPLPNPASRSWGCWNPTNLLPPTPTLISGALQIAANDSATCALLESSVVECWGETRLGMQSGPYSSRIRELPRDADARALFAGPLSTVVVTTRGSYLLGANVAAGGIVRVPAIVPELKGATSMSLARDRALLLRPDGSVICLGKSPHGECGEVSADRIRRSLFRGAVGVATGDRHTCILAADGAVRCWGSDAMGQLGGGGGIDTGAEGVEIRGIP